MDEVVAEEDGLYVALRTYPAGQSRSPHTHPEMTFFLVLSGGVTESCAARPWHLESFDLVAQTPEVKHSSVVSDVGMRAMFLQVSRSWLALRMTSIPDIHAYDLVEGARVVEAYPVAPDSPSYRFMGFVPAFEKAGFREVGRAGSRRHVMRLEV